MLLTFEAGGDEVFTSGYAGQVKYQKDGPRTGPLCVDVIFFWGMPGWDKGASDARIGDFEKLDERFQEPAELK